MAKKDMTHKRWRSYVVRRVTFVLADASHKLVLVNAQMRVRLKKAEYDHNVYEAEIHKAWLLLGPVLRQLDYVGVLYADSSREFAGRIAWVEDADPDAMEKTAHRADREKVHG